MKRFIIILSLMLLLTSCSPKPGDMDKENGLPTTGTIENINDEENNEIDTDNKYEKIANEYTSSEGYRVIEYEDGYITTLSPEGAMTIVKTPEPNDFTKYYDVPLEELPKEDGTEFVHDLRSKDISGIDLSNELDYLLIADFDDDTKWPSNVPKEYDIEKIREYGMDPGLGIKKGLQERE